MSVTATSNKPGLIPNPRGVTCRSSGQLHQRERDRQSLVHAGVWCQRHGEDHRHRDGQRRHRHHPLGSANINTINEVFTVTVTPINAPPTLNPIPSPGTIPENSGPQTVPISGISGGASASQILTVTAASSNTGLIPNPTVTYNSPDTTGYITYTPAANISGTATITVTVTDNGGTANGGQNTVSQTFTVTSRRSTSRPRSTRSRTPPRWRSMPLSRRSLSPASAPERVTPGRR